MTVMVLVRLMLQHHDCPWCWSIKRTWAQGANSALHIVKRSTHAGPLRAGACPQVQGRPAEASWLSATGQTGHCILSLSPWPAQAGGGCLQPHTDPGPLLLKRLHWPGSAQPEQRHQAGSRCTLEWLSISDSRLICISWLLQQVIWAPQDFLHCAMLCNCRRTREGGAC